MKKKEQKVRIYNIEKEIEIENQKLYQLKIKLASTPPKTISPSTSPSKTISTSPSPKTISPFPLVSLPTQIIVPTNKIHKLKILIDNHFTKINN